MRDGHRCKLSAPGREFQYTSCIPALPLLGGIRVDFLLYWKSVLGELRSEVKFTYYSMEKWYNFPIQTTQNVKIKLPRRLILHEP